MKLEFSAGGILYNNQKGRKLILVAQHSQHHGWVFPKGLIGDKESGIMQLSRVQTEGNHESSRETKEEAALREVREETGINGKIIKALPPITYWYEFNNEKIKKTVYYFLMEYVSGNTKDHDFEMENVEWLPMDKVLERLTYNSDKKVWKEAKKSLVSS